MNTEKLESLIGADSTSKGDISTQGTIRVDGTVEGNIEADWVILREKSHMSGDITARGIIVGGNVRAI